MNQAEVQRYRQQTHEAMHDPQRRGRYLILGEKPRLIFARKENCISIRFETGVSSWIRLSAGNQNLYLGRNS